MTQIETLICGGLTQKIESFKIPLQTKRSRPSPPVIQNLVSGVQSEERYSFSDRAHFWPLDMI